MASIPPPCSICTKPCSSKLPMIACSGLCSQSYHLGCVNLSLELKDVLKNTPGLIWRCQACRRGTGSIEGKIEKMLETINQNFTDKLLELEKTYLKRIEMIRSEFDDRIESSINARGKFPAPDVGINASYAQVTSAASTTRILVQPRTRDQNVKTTKADIIEKIDPIAQKINVRGVKPAKDGGVILGCASSEDTKKLYSAISSELSENYTVKEMNGIMPSVRIVGLSQQLDSKTVVQYLRNQNEHIFMSESNCEVVKVEPLKKRPSVYCVHTKVDVQTYKRLLSQKHILIGLDGCTVYDGFSVKRCYCCNGYNHIASRCPEKNKPICAKCAGSHDGNQCALDNENYNCCNCSKSNQSKGTTFDTNHAAYDYAKCTFYINYQKNMKSLLFGSFDVK